MNSVIIEDEKRNVIVLQSLLETYCPEVKVTGVANSVTSGIRLIGEQEPDLIFLDIQLIGGTGFDILEKFDEINAEVIFTTAYDRYALKAFKFSAIDYLLKPIDIDELKQAVKRALNSGRKHINNQKIQNLLSNLDTKTKDDPIMLVSTIDTIEFIRVQEIVRIEAQGAYSKIHMKSKKSLLASKVIKEFDLLLKGHAFHRVHQSHIINMSCVDKFLKGQSCFLLKDGSKIQLARTRKDQFFEEFKKIHG